MLESAHVIVEIYKEIASSIAEPKGMSYPIELEKIMVERLNKLPII